MTTRINERELALKIPYKASWHAEYEGKNTVSVANLPLEITEGDLLVLFAQCGPIEDVYIYRKDQIPNSGAKPPATRRRGLVVFEDFKSTVVAIDNFDEWEVVPGRKLRVAHSDEKIPDEPTEWRNAVRELMQNWK